MRKLKCILLIIIALIAQNIYSQTDKIRIILKQPPPNQMGVGDMWNITLTNTTKEDLKIYLTGTATEEKGGLIVEGKSKVFTIQPGKTSYKYNDFSGAEIKYNNSKYKEIMLRQGNAPEGNYTICVTAFLESGDIAGQENCIINPVKQMGSITLISPEDGGEITPEQPIIFSWTPLPGAKEYTLRIVEIKGDQSPDVAMKTNKPVWEKSGITTTTTQVPSKIPFGDYGGDDDYLAWTVISGNVESEVYMFSLQAKNTSLSSSQNSSCLACGENYSEGENLIINGDFTLGNTGFISNAVYKLPSVSLWQGCYTVTNDIKKNNKQWCALDHTNGISSSPGFLVCDGFIKNDTKVWEQEVTVSPNTKYVFCAWFKNLVCSNKDFEDPDIWVELDDVLAGSLKPKEVDSWQPISAEWTSGASTSCIIRIYMKKSVSGFSAGNDLGVDDISLKPCSKLPVKCNILSDDYTNPSLWGSVFKQNNYLLGDDELPHWGSCGNRSGSATYNSIKVDGGVCKFNQALNGRENRVFRDLNIILDNSWKAEFEFIYSEIGDGKYVSHIILGITAGNDNNPVNDSKNKNNFLCYYSDMDAIMVWFWYPTNTYYLNLGVPAPEYQNPAGVRKPGIVPWLKDGNGLNGAIPNYNQWTPNVQLIPIDANVRYYITFERLNATRGRISVFTDARKTIHAENSPQCFDIPSAIQGLNAVQHAVTPYGADAKTLTGEVDNLCITDIDEITITNCQSK